MSDIVKRVQELLKLPQSLCNTCGKCCKMVNFKGGLSYEEVKNLSQSLEEDETQVEGARDFLSIFQPYESIEAAREYSNEFVEKVLARFPDKKEIGFFHCRYVGKNNLCLIHEDRPLLCRMYPIPHERTEYHAGCGFEEQGRKNWQEIKAILADLEKQREQLKKDLNQKKNSLDNK